MEFTGALIHTGCMLRLTFWVGISITVFWDLLPLLQFYSTSTYVNELELLIAGGKDIIVLTVIIFSWFHLIQDPLNEAQWEQTQKLHHLHIPYTSVSLFFGSSGFMYLKSSLAISMDEWKIYPIFYTIVVPMVIPLIYSLRRKDVTVALRKILRRTILSSEI